MGLAQLILVAKLCDCTSEQVLQSDVVYVCLKEISCEDEARLRAYRAALHLCRHQQT